MKRLLFGLIITAWLLVGCKSDGDAIATTPSGAVSAALRFCPLEECTNTKIGPGTKKLPYQESEGVYARWCVEVLFTRTGEDGQAAVVVEMTEADAGNNPFAWQAYEPTYNAGCEE